MNSPLFTASAWGVGLFLNLNCCYVFSLRPDSSHDVPLGSCLSTLQVMQLADTTRVCVTGPSMWAWLHGTKRLAAQVETKSMYAIVRHVFRGNSDSVCDTGGFPCPTWMEPILALRYFSPLVQMIIDMSLPQLTHRALSFQ